jgi:hypothetical protein
MACNTYNQMQMEGSYKSCVNVVVLSDTDAQFYSNAQCNSHDLKVKGSCAQGSNIMSVPIFFTDGLETRSSHHAFT